MKKLIISWIEIDNKHYLSIGKKAPRDNKLRIRVPLFVAKLFGGKGLTIPRF